VADSTEFRESLEGLWPSPDYFHYLERLKQGDRLSDLSGGN